MEPVFERYSPQHPLPEEIQNLPRDDTVCHYCGVSYLIHREIKMLEEKLQKLEEELEKCRDCEQRESELLVHVGDLQSSIKMLENENKNLLKTSTSLTEQLNVRTKELKTEQQHLKNLEEDISDLNQEVSGLTKENESQRNKNSSLQSKVVSIFNSLKHEKEEVAHISSIIEQDKVQISSMFKDFWHYIKQVNVAHQMDIQRLKMSLVEMEREKYEILHEKNKQIEAEKKEELIQKVNSLQSETKCLKTKLKSDEEKIEELKQKLNKSEDNCRYTNSESNQYKEQIKNMKQTVEDLNVQLRKKEQDLENLLQKSQMESHDLQQKLQAARREHKKAQDQLLEKQTAVNENQRKQDLSLSLIEQLKKSERHLLMELEAVKQEREQATISHHQQIEDLKESYRHKSADYDQWPLKLETVQQQERNKHNKEMQELKGKLTENFLMDLEIEKQKYQKLVDKYHEDSQNTQDKLKEQVENAVKCHVDAIKDLEELLSTTRSSCAEKEESLIKEVDGLKQVIKDLQTQLFQMGNAGQDEVTQLKTQLRSAQQEVTNLKEQVQSIHQQLEEARSQVLSLQETVQKECEERLELTESLTAARTELLQLKKPTGGYNKLVSKSPLPQSLSSRNKLSGISLNGEGNNTNNYPPATSLSDSFVTKAKSVDQPKLNPLRVGTGHQGSVSMSQETASNNKETKPVKGFLTDQKSVPYKRKISDNRRRFLALLTRNSAKISN